MKKLFNYALLAAALLIGVNVNAAKPTHDQATTPHVYAIEQALNNGNDYKIPDGGDVDFVLECPLDLTIGGDGEATLDLNGHNLVYAYTPVQGVKDENWYQGRMINLMKGTLNVTNGKIATGGNIENRTDTVPGSFNNSIDVWEGKFAFGYYKTADATTLEKGGEIVVFSVTGSANPTDKEYTVLNIDQVVTVSATKGKVGIIINKVANMFTNDAWSYKYYNPTILHKEVTKYTATTAKKNIGLSYGVVVNVEGKVHGEKYGIQVSGNVSAAPGDNSAYYFANSVGSQPESGSSKFWDCQFLNGHTQAEVTIAETAAFPIIWIKSTAEVWANPTAMVNGNGLYVGGYAQVTINGYVHGSNGVYAKSGDIDIKDAVIASDNPNYSETGGNKSGSGTEGAGNAIVIESTSGYAGGTDVTISGDTKVEAQSGYAIQEVVTKGGETKVDGVTIEGGTFIGGTQGGVIFSEETTTSGEGGTSKVDIGGGSFTDEDVENYVNPGGTGDKVITTITDANGNVIGTVITNDPNAPQDKTDCLNKTDLKTKIYKYLYWEKPEGGGTAPTYTVADGETLTLYNFTADWGHITVAKGGKLVFDSIPAETEGGVGIQTKVVLNGTAYIYVQPGGTLISNSKLGIETATVQNLWICAKENNMAQFLYNPAVNQGRHPNAIVQFYSKGCNLVNYDRFGIPSYEDMTPMQILAESGVTSYIYKYNSAIDDWVKLNGGDKMKPFQGLTMTNNQTGPGHVYQFPCRVYGNVNAEILTINGWNSYSNSYTANADIKELVQALVTTYGEHMEGGIHVYKNGSATTAWYPLSLADFIDGDNEYGKTYLEPMQAFLLKMRQGDHIQLGINYEQNVWNLAMGITSGGDKAPRQGMVDMNKVVITLTDAQGANTRLTIRESAEFSADFDNGADMSAYMNENRFNFYATTDYADQCQIATDNIEGQVLTLATKGETSFTMSFSNVRGEKMALVDNMTGDVIEMAEGVTYNFIANANEVSERFTVVAAAQAPTALKKAEASAKAAKFINNGQVILQNNGRLFNVLGTEVK